MEVETANYVGKILGEFLIMQKMHEGRFADIYSGVHVQTADKAIFKVAKTGESENATNFHSTKALMFVTGGVRGIKPDTNDLLELQYRYLKQSAASPELVTVHKIFRDHSLCYIQMEHVEGQSLEELMSGKLDFAERRKLLTAILDSAARMLASSKAHGDLKPANIMHGSDGVRFIDPGYFGPLRTEFGADDDCVVTTPAYYPSLIADDLFALGITAWQLITAKHPLVSSEYPEHYDKDRFSKAVLDRVIALERVGQHFLSPLLHLKLPRQISPEISEVQQSRLLKGLRLELRSDGVLDISPGFQSAKELAEAWR